MVVESHAREVWKDITLLIPPVQGVLEVFRACTKVTIKFVLQVVDLWLAQGIKDVQGGLA